MTSPRCPHCGELVDIYVDPGGLDRQSFIEDCSVCCRPMRVQAVRVPDSDEEFTVEVSGDV